MLLQVLLHHQLEIINPTKVNILSNKNTPKIDLIYKFNYTRIDSEVRQIFEERAFRKLGQYTKSLYNNINTLFAKDLLSGVKNYYSALLTALHLNSLKELFNFFNYLHDLHLNGEKYEFEDFLNKINDYILTKSVKQEYIF